MTKTHERIANQRRDFNHKLARRLVVEFSLIGVEDLSILGLSRSNLAKSVNDVAWGQLLAFLWYKAEEAGAEVVSVDPGIPRKPALVAVRLFVKLSVFVFIVVLIAVSN